MEEYGGEYDREDGGEENGGVKCGFSPLPLPFGVLSPSPPSLFEELSPFGGLELLPYNLVFLSS